MTVCIAVRCVENNSFVLAGDRLFSYGMDSLDSMSLKRVMITPDHRWKAMFAASPVSNVMPIIRRARHTLFTGTYSLPHTLDAIRDATVEAFQAQRERIVNETILSKYKTTLSEWRQSALNFGEKEVARINETIEVIEVGVKLIVFGYDHRNVAYIFTVVEPGTSVDYDMEGIAIAGSGGGHAQQSLISRDLPFQSQADLMCRALEAKFAAEQDANVGPDSCAGVVNEPPDTLISSEAPEKFMRNPAMQKVRAAVLASQINPYPRDVVEAVRDDLSSALTSEEIDSLVREAMQRIMRERGR